MSAGAPFRAVLAGRDLTKTFARIVSDCGVPLHRIALFGNTYRLITALDAYDLDPSDFGDAMFGSARQAVIERCSLSRNLVDRPPITAVDLFTEMIKVVGMVGDDRKSQRFLNGRRAMVRRIMQAHVEAHLRGKTLPSHPLVDEIVEHYRAYKEEFWLMDRADVEHAPVRTIEDCDLLLFDRVRPCWRRLARRIFPRAQFEIVGFERDQDLALLVTGAGSANIDSCLACSTASPFDDGRRRPRRAEPAVSSDEAPESAEDQPAIEAGRRGGG